MNESSIVSNQNNGNNVNPQGNNNDYKRRINSASIAIKLLKVLFEKEGYYFSSFSSREHGKLVKQITENSEEQEKKGPIELNGDPVVNEFVNSFYRIFNISKANNDGMVQYEIYSVHSLNSTSTDNQYKSIWLPRSMIIIDAHRIFCTKLYSTNDNTIPVDLADYVLVYENIMISLENQNKELYEELLKISFRLNRVGLPPFRLLIIHKSHLLLLERKESKPILKENEPMSILQLIIFHLFGNTTQSLENENFSYTETTTATDKNGKNEYWPMVEVKMGIIPSSKLIHPLKHDKLRQIIAYIIKTSGLSGDIKTNVDVCIKLLEEIFLSVNVDRSHVKLITTSLSKPVEIYDYPLLIALPYDRLLLAQFCKIQCCDGRWAQGIVTNGKYYSLISHPYIPMADLKINRGSIVHLRFHWQHDTITNGNISTESSKVIFNESYEDATGSYCSVYCDDHAVQLMFPSQVIDSLMTTTDTINTTRISYLRSCLEASNNWNDSSKNINKLIMFGTEQQLSSVDAYSIETNRNNYTDNISAYDYRSARLINNASTSSMLPLLDKPECSNCLSQLHDDNLECPQCTQVFCRECIESSYDDFSHNHYCPKCYYEAKLSEYRRSVIIGKFDRDGINVFKCLNCKSIPKPHRLCRDPNCSALFCYDCCKKTTEVQSAATNQEVNSTGTVKCPRCKTADTYVSGAVFYYILRITEYQMAEIIESNSEASSTTPSFPNTIWDQEDYLPEIGTLAENNNRVISLVMFKHSHIEFGNKKEDCPRLIIDEPCEYACPESLQLSYWNPDPEMNCWENDKNARFYKYNQSSIAAYIPHFSTFTARNTRLIEHIMLDKAFLAIPYDCDFTKTDDTGRNFERGPEPYTRPCGWYRLAIRVLGKFGNNIWLGEGTNAWPVAYHGTSTNNVLPILRNGLLAGGSNGIPISHGAVHGAGIYLSPNPRYSGSPIYSKPTTLDDRRYQVMFQVRVKPNSYSRTSNRNAWICGNSQDVRPYGILYKEL